MTSEVIDKFQKKVKMFNFLIKPFKKCYVNLRASRRIDNFLIESHNQDEPKDKKSIQIVRTS